MVLPEGLPISDEQDKIPDFEPELFLVESGLVRVVHDDPKMTSNIILARGYQPPINNEGATASDIIMNRARTAANR